MAENPNREVDVAVLVRRLRTLLYAGIGIAAAVLITYLWKFGVVFSDKHSVWGEFGDYVGGLLNPTFGFLALIALLGALQMQARELKLAMEELAKTSEALANQNHTLRKQTFEGTFFQTLRLHNDIVASLEIVERSLRGRACFAHYVNQLEHTIDRLNEPHYFHPKQQEHITLAEPQYLEEFKRLYDEFYANFQAELGHYFRLLYNIIKLVKNTKDIDQRFYTNLVRAQLSSAELTLIFFNCVSDWGNEKFKPLVEEFALLKTLSIETRTAARLLKTYSVDAFGGQYPKSKYP